LPRIDSPRRAYPRLCPPCAAWPGLANPWLGFFSQPLRKSGCRLVFDLRPKRYDEFSKWTFAVWTKIPQANPLARRIDNLAKELQGNDVGVDLRFFEITSLS